MRRSISSQACSALYTFSDEVSVELCGLRLFKLLFSALRPDCEAPRINGTHYSFSNSQVFSTRHSFGAQRILTTTANASGKLPPWAVLLSLSSITVDPSEAVLPIHCCYVWGEEIEQTAVKWSQRRFRDRTSAKGKAVYLQRSSKRLWDHLTKLKVFKLAGIWRKRCSMTTLVCSWLRKKQKKNPKIQTRIFLKDHIHKC